MKPNRNKITGRRISTWKTITVLDDSYGNAAILKIFELNNLGKLKTHFPIKRNRKLVEAYNQLISSSNKKLTDLNNDINNDINNDLNNDLNDINNDICFDINKEQDLNQVEMEILKIESSISLFDMPFAADFNDPFNIDFINEEEKQKETDDEIFNGPFSFFF